MAYVRIREKLNLLNKVRWRASVDHIIRRILMAVLPRDRALYTMDDEQASGKQVFPGGGNGRENEELAEVVISVIGGASCRCLHRYSFFERGRDSDEEELDLANRCIRLLSDVTGYTSMVPACFTRPDCILNCPPGCGVDSAH
jgi:hypothetical protein